MDKYQGTPPNAAEFEVHRLIGFGVPAEAADYNLAAMWDAIPQAERAELTRAFAQGFSEGCCDE